MQLKLIIPALLTSLLADMPQCMYVGLYNNWEWTDNSPVTYMNWAYGEPDNYVGII